jgi:hypothetical protein
VSRSSGKGNCAYSVWPLSKGLSLSLTCLDTFYSEIFGTSQRCAVLRSVKHIA